LEERTADVVMTTEQLKREIRNQKKKEQESRKAQTQIFRAQKPETFGELIAGFANGMNNPTNFITLN